jgi:hypothetical protein
MSFREWFGRKVSHGRGAARASTGRPGAGTPPAVPLWLVVATALLASLSRWGVAGGLLTLVAALIRLRRVFAELDNPTRVAAIQMARGCSAGLWRMVSALCRDYWPVTLLAMLTSRRIRQVAVTMAVADGLADWFTHRDSGGLDPVRYLACKRLDDLAYGTGLWWGALPFTSAFTAP